MMHLTRRISSGETGWEDVELLREVANQVRGKCLCALGEFSIEAVMSVPTKAGVNQQNKMSWPWEWNGNAPVPQTTFEKPGCATWQW